MAPLKHFLMGDSLSIMVMHVHNMIQNSYGMLCAANTSAACWAKHVPAKDQAHCGQDALRHLKCARTKTEGACACAEQCMSPRVF